MPVTTARRRKAVLAALISIAALYSCAFAWTAGGATEFCPYTLQTRWRSELMLPFTRFSIYRSSWIVGRYPAAERFIQLGYWSPDPLRPPEWRLECRWNRQWRDGHSLLHRDLAWNRELVSWAEDHPEIASIVLPEVLRLLQSNDSVDRRTAEERLHFAVHLQSMDDLKTIEGAARSR
jgi:hypothetical protein